MLIPLRERLFVRRPDLSEPFIQKVFNQSAADKPAGAGYHQHQAASSEPSGALSIFEAVTKQLGLKLELRKRMEPVLVIDHIEPKPTEN
jgi:uncharacterized protein (TIGR03435 family)